MLNVQKNNYHENRKESSIPTPEFLIDFIYDTVPDKYHDIVLDLACGDGRLLRGERNWGIDIKEPPEGFKVELELFEEFNALHEEKLLQFKNDRLPERPSLVIFNPPFNHAAKSSGVLLPEEFIKRVAFTWGLKQPMVVVAPIGLLANQRLYSSRWRWFRDHPELELSSIISLPLDIFTPESSMKEYKSLSREIKKRDNPKTHKGILKELKDLRRQMRIVEFHTEILCYNIPEMKPHYFIPKKYLP